MASGYKKAGNDLDNIFAAYVSGDPHAGVTGYQVGGTDLNQRYSELPRGSAAAATGYKVTGSDLNIYFAAKGTVLDPLVLYPQGGVGSSTLPSAARLLTTVPTGSVVSQQTNVTNTNTGFGEIYGRGNNGSWPGFGFLPNPDDNGMLFDSTLLEGTSLAAGTWTMDIWLEGNNAAFPSGFTVYVADIHFRAFKRSSGGVYTAIGDAVLTNQNLINDQFHHFTATFSGAQTSFGTGDKLYTDVWLNLTSNLTSPPDASAITIEYGSGGLARTTVTTPGYVVA